MDFALTAQQQEIIERFGQLGRERFAPRAALFDRENRFPRENFEDLQAEGLLGLCIPREYGGMGIGLHSEPLTWVLILEEMAKSCASTSQTFQILGHCMTYFADLGTEAQREKVYRGVLEKGWLVCSAGSEPASFTMARRGGLGVGTIAESVAGGYRLNGRKHFNTLSGEAKLYVVFARLKEEQDPSRALILPMVWEDNPGLREIHDWDALGMRATATNSEEYVDCFVSADNVVGGPGGYFDCVVPYTYFTAFAANYLGAAEEGAFEWTLQYVTDMLGSAQDPVMQHHLGALDNALEGARLALQKAGWLADVWEKNGRRIADREAAWKAAHYAKLACAETAVAVTNKCIQLCGGRGTLTGSPLGRMLRDVRTYTVAPPSIDRIKEALGQMALGPATRGQVYGGGQSAHQAG